MSDVIFRRIHGRIIPIRVSDENKKAAKGVLTGAAIAAAGVGVALVSGNTYRRAVMNSAGSAMKAFGKVEKAFDMVKPAQATMFDFAAKEKGAAKAFESLRSAARVAQSAKFLRNVSLPLSATLITGGAVKALNSLPRDGRKQINPALVAGGGAAAAVALPKAFALSKEAFTAGQGGRQMAMGFASGKFQSALPAIKNLGMKFLKKGF